MAEGHAEVGPLQKQAHRVVGCLQEQGHGERLLGALEGEVPAQLLRGVLATQEDRGGLLLGALSAVRLLVGPISAVRLVVLAEAGRVRHHLLVVRDHLLLRVVLWVALLRAVHPDLEAHPGLEAHPLEEALWVEELHGHA